MILVKNQINDGYNRSKKSWLHDNNVEIIQNILKEY